MRAIAALGCSLIALAGLAGAATPPLQQGLVITVVTRAGLVGNGASLAVADTETLYSVANLQDDRVWFSFSVAAPSDRKASDLLKEPLTLKRAVRKEDLVSSNRLSLFWSNEDPDLLAGQTFIQTSAAVLNALKTKGETPIVVGVNEDGMMAGLAALPAAAAGAGGAPADLSGFLSAMGVERHYYRGTLKRVEAGTVPFSVLLDGVRTTVPAVHARGTIKFTDRSLEAEFYWLDDPANALTLKWSLQKAHALVTRIDFHQPPLKASTAGPGKLNDSPAATALAGKACRAEIPGIYFATGSARLLKESTPTLEELGSLLKANPAWTVTIEGHTDNIGSADYNLDLSNRRAAAVRKALTGTYQVPAARIRAKGFGLTKPRESNASEEGRARNRRVEIARDCAI